MIVQDNALLSAAKSYAARGWRVIPLYNISGLTGKCSCGKPSGKCKPGKHPRISEWQHMATTDTSIIEGWWKQWPHANIGIVCGKESGIFAVGPDGQEGIDDLAALKAQHGEIPSTVTSATPGGGRHYLSLWPADGGAPIGQSANIHGAKIDIRGEGGYIVAPPSASDKGAYEWSLSPDTFPVAEAPEWLVQWVRDGQGVGKRKTTTAKIGSRLKYGPR